MKLLRPDVAGHHLADAQARGRPVRRRDLGPHGRQPRRRPLQLLGWRPRRLRAPGLAARPLQEEHRRAHRRRDRHVQAGRPDPRRHHHRRPRRQRRLRARQRAEHAGSATAYSDRFSLPPGLPVLPHGPGHPRPQGGLREGPGRRRRARPGPGHRRLRGPDLPVAQRHGQDGHRQGPPGRLRGRLRHREERRAARSPSST